MTITQSDEATHADRRRFPHALALIAVLTCLFAGVALADVYVGGLLAFGVGVVYLVVIAVGIAGLREFGTRDLGAVVGLVILIFLMACGAGVTAYENLILSSGRNVTTVVMFEKVEKSLRGGETWTYTLFPKHPAEDIPGGHLEQDSHRFKPGDTVVVRVDPAGRVAPKLPGEADSPAALWGAIGLNAVIAGIVFWAARKPRPPRPPGPTRRRLAARWKRARERFRALTGWPFVVVAAVLSAAWLGLFRLALGFDLTLTVMAGVAYLFVMSGFFGMFDDDKAKNVFRGRAVLTVALVTIALGAYLCATT
ncbi:hypothetical protein ACIRYZ_17970 [Kitasatospora sp. NPDC101155]|uniref:hypothetical protein n=1 Tax=Kitasatospora sp. NPDC101155 TaxID=3364097 RepID=UPI0037F4F9D3